MPDNPIHNLPPHILAQLGAMLVPFLTASSPQSQPAPGPNAPHIPLLAPPAASTSPMVPSHASPLQRNHAIQSVLPSITAYQSSRLPPASQPRNPSPLRQFLAPPQEQRHPFLGFQDTRQVNSQRLASAAATIPRRTTLALRAARSPYTSSAASGSGSGTRRGARGPAGTLPSLSQTRGIDSCIVTSIADGSRRIQILCKIYPPLEAQATDYVVFLQRRDSFNQSLAAHHLLQKLEVPLDTSIRSIMSTLTARLQNSPHQYTFGYDEEMGLLPHEALPLSLLRVSNRARRRPSTNQIHLIEHPVLTEEITVNNLVTDTSRFVFPDISFEDRQFVLFFAIRAEDMAVRLPSNGHTSTRIHTCIGLRIWSKFPNDDRGARATIEETSGGETDSDHDAEELGLVPTDDESLPDVETVVGRVQAQAYAGANAPAQPTQQVPIQPLAPGRVVERSATLTSLEGPLWSTPWTPPALSRHINVPLNLAAADTEIFEMAVGALPRIPNLVICGISTLDLSQKLLTVLGEAVDSNDFAKVLSPSRSFQIDGPRAEDYGLLSYGRGIEREVIHLAFQHYLSSDSQWLMPRASGFSSIATTSRYASASRLRNLSILGALVGLLIIHGMAPTPISPGLLHYGLHGCNLSSLHPKFVQEWLPDVYQTIKSWLATPYASQDLSEFSGHFSTFHDIQTASLKDRDEVGHKALAAEMLHRAIIGPEPSSHPELQAFFQGLRLNCPASGFDLTKLCVLVEGGSEAYLNMVYGSNIKEYDDLAGHIRFKTPLPSVSSLVNSALQGHDVVSFSELFENFMRGAGIPLPTLFESCQPHFSPLIDLEGIDAVSFRSRHFTWAATGSPALEVAGEGIIISLCGAGDTGYASSSMSEAMMRQGKICFKTCLKQVRIPVPYLATLSALHPPGGSDPVTFQNVFDHWLLTEILNGIGGHSIL